MTDLDDLDLMGATTPATPNVTTKRCYRHSWYEVAGPYIGDTAISKCGRCGKVKDSAVSRRSRNNRKRGNRTSLDLAKYLGGRNVEAMKWPWDVEAEGARIQSKRLATKPSANAIAGFIEAIDYRTDNLRAFFYVPASKPLQTGIVYASLAEWTEWHGMEGGIAEGDLVSMTLPEFRDIHIGETREEAS